MEKSLAKKEQELRKINETHIKVQTKLDKQIEKNKSLDQNIDDLVADKVDEIIKEKNEALNAIYGVKKMLEEKLTKIEQLKATALTNKKERETLQDSYEENKSELNRAQFKLKALDKKLVTLKVQTDEKLEEID